MLGGAEEIRTIVLPASIISDGKEVKLLKKFYCDHVDGKKHWLKRYYIIQDNI